MKADLRSPSQKADVAPLMEMPTDMVGAGLRLGILGNGEGSWGAGATQPHPTPGLSAVSFCVIEAAVRGFVGVNGLVFEGTEKWLSFQTSHCYADTSVYLSPAPGKWKRLFPCEVEKKIRT